MLVPLAGGASGPPPPVQAGAEARRRFGAGLQRAARGAAYTVWAVGDHAERELASGAQASRKHVRGAISPRGERGERESRSLNTMTAWSPASTYELLSYYRDCQLLRTRD